MCDVEKGVQTELGQVRGPTFHLLTPRMCLRVSRLCVSWNAGVWPGRPGRPLPCPVSLEFREVCG